MGRAFDNKWQLMHALYGISLASQATLCRTMYFCVWNHACLSRTVSFVSKEWHNICTSSIWTFGRNGGFGCLRSKKSICHHPCDRRAEPGYLWWVSHHDDVIKWKLFPRYWPLVRGIHRSPVDSPHKGQWHGALMFSFISAWANNQDAGDLSGHLAHNDVTVI